MIDKRRIKITTTNSLTYKTKKYRYTIHLSYTFKSIKIGNRKFRTIRFRTPGVIITYSSSIMSKKIGTDNKKIPKIHQQAIKELIDIYEQMIIIPMKFSGELKDEYNSNWVEEAINANKKNNS